MTHWDNDNLQFGPQACVAEFIANLVADEWFGSTEVDTEVPKTLWPKFEEIPPLFYNKEVHESAVPKEMLDYLLRTGRTPVKGQKKLVGTLSAENILLYAPVLRWYIDHGLMLSHEFIEQLTTNQKQSLAGSLKKSPRPVDKESLISQKRFLPTSSSFWETRVMAD